MRRSSLRKRGSRRSAAPNCARRHERSPQRNFRRAPISSQASRSRSGEIFQIQEDGGDNFFLINTECETEFDIRLCDGPTVHVTYDESTDKTEDDFVTVYGIVEGGYEYDTSIGGSNFVASVDAEIIE